MSLTNELHPYNKPNVKLLKTKSKAKNTYNRKRVNEVSVDGIKRTHTAKQKKKRKHRSKLFINSMIIKENYRLKGFTQLGDR